MARHKDLTGQKFGTLTAIEYMGKRKWKCVCECGNNKIVGTTNIRSIKSCGCLGRGRSLPKGEAGFNWLVYRYKRQAQERNLLWELSIEEFRSLTEKPCYYCGRYPNQVSAKDYVYNGVDRLNNKLGYSAKNCVACCGQCNYAKKDLSVSEFTEWVTCIFYHHVADRN